MNNVKVERKNTYPCSYTSNAHNSGFSYLVSPLNVKKDYKIKIVPNIHYRFVSEDNQKANIKTK